MTPVIARKVKALNAMECQFGLVSPVRILATQENVHVLMAVDDEPGLESWQAACAPRHRRKAGSINRAAARDIKPDDAP
jgi:hypothetical protein